MTFPATPLDMTVEIKLDGTWTDITSLVYARDNLTIGRGRSGEGSDAERSTCRFTVNNRSGNLSPRNPVGTYYGLIGRNTPCRVRLSPAGTGYLLNYTRDLLNSVSTPDSAALSITGDIDVRTDIEPDAWGIVAGLGMKYVSNGDQRSWMFAVNQDNRLYFRWSTAGTFASIQERTSTAAFATPADGRLALRVTLDVDNGAAGHDVKFYTAPTIAGSWTQLGSTITTGGTTSIFDSTAAVQLSGLPVEGLRDFVIGRVYAFQVYQGIAGTLRADIDFDTDVEPGDLTFTDGAGVPWTITSDMSVVDPALRFRGEISEWPQRWDVSGRDVYVPIEASGILRRLKQGASPVQSTMYRGYTSLTGANVPRAYWPAEDGEDATEIASALGGPAMKLSGTPDLASNTDFPSSGPIPVLTNSEWTGKVPAYTGTGKVQVFMLVSIPEGGATDGQAIFSVYTTGTVYRWSLIYTVGTNGNLTLKGYNALDVELETSGAIDFGLNGHPERISLSLEQSGSNIAWELLGQQLDGTVGGTGSTFTGRTVSRATSVVVNPGGGLGDVAFGHVSVHSDVRDPFELIDEFQAHLGEAAGRRLERLCEQNGVAFRIVGDIDQTTLMGVQGADELVDLLQEAAYADGGILYEPRDMYGLAYRTRESLYSQDAALELDYSAKHLSHIEPVDDDQSIRNDITVKREGGSSARAIKEDGPLSIEAPPDGVGRYDEEVTLNLEHDGQLPDVAGWRLHLGTIDQARYPVLSVNLGRSVFAASATLTRAVEDLDVGDRLTVENPPTWLPPDDISQLAQGFTETMAAFTHIIDINCSPETPYGQVGYYDDTAARYSSDGSTLNEALTTTETDVDVATPSGPLWSHADGNFDIKVGGEVMTVTAVSGATSPQTFTCTRSVNGIVKTHSSGAVVELAHPSVYVQ